MKKHSCGALLFTIHNNEVYIVLGMEKNDWFPFKGTKEPNESLHETAIREVYEETCGIVKLDNIYLDCVYSTKRKYYYIGLVFVNIDVLNKFHKKRNECKKMDINNNPFLEKSSIKLFNINKLHFYNFHNISLIPINYYKNFLFDLQKRINNLSFNIDMSNNYLKMTYPTNSKKSPNINSLFKYDDKKININKLYI